MEDQNKTTEINGEVQEIEIDLKDIEAINGVKLKTPTDLDPLTGGIDEPSKGGIDVPSKSEPSGPPKKLLSEDAREWIKDILCAVLLAAVILQFIMPTVVREHSMENTLQENDYLFVSKKAYTWFGGNPSRGDIIVFQSNLPFTSNTNKLLVKRIIGVEGDSVAIKDGITYVNGKPLTEDFTKDGYTLGDMDPVIVPANSLFCMGDNRQNSGDSRDSRIGFVDVSTVKGKVVFRLFPFSSFGRINQVDIDGQLQ